MYYVAHIYLYTHIHTHIYLYIFYIYTHTYFFFFSPTLWVNPKYTKDILLPKITGMLKEFFLNPQILFEDHCLKIYLLESRVVERERLRYSDAFYPLIHSINGHNGQSWVSLKLGVRRLFLVSDCESRGPGT